MATSTPRPTQPKCPDQAIDQLRMSIRGEVLTPEEPGYATVPVPFNAMYPGRPAVVVRAAGVADVIDAVRFAREHGLRWRSVVAATRSRASPASTMACY